MSAARYWFIFPLILLIAQGCNSGEVGDSCGKESDCKSGLRCFKPTGASDKICTVLCENGSCSGGTCVSTEDGELCAQPCSAEYIFTFACDDGKSCQLLDETFPQDGQTFEAMKYACWTSETCLGNKDGQSEGPTIIHSSSETSDSQTAGNVIVTTSIFVRNLSHATLTGLYAKVETIPQDTTLVYCNAGDGTSYKWTTYNTCGYSDCNCKNYPNDLPACATFPVPLIIVKLDMKAQKATTPFPLDIVFTDAQGKTWPRTLTVEVAQ